MFRLTDIYNSLSGVVGWEQDFNPAKQIDESLTRSESGLTFQGAHPLVTLENIRQVMPEDWAFQYPAWDADTRYGAGQKVSHGGKIWKAKVATEGDEPTADSGVWGEFDMLSDYLVSLTRNGINTAIQTFISEKQMRNETKSLLERRTLFDGAARLQAIIDPRSKVVGLEIVPVRALGVTTKIERIGLQMVGAVGTIRMYLFHSSQYEPIRILDLEYTKTNGGFQWFKPAEDVYLPYLGAGTDSGGAWYLCYSQDELPNGMYALNVAKDWSKEPCATCSGYSLESWREITKYMQISPFCTNVPEGFSESPALFDVGALGYTNTINYGINLEVSVGCDLTDFIVSQRLVFANVIQKQVAVNVLRTIAMNPDVRVNRNQLNATRDEILYEVDGNPQGRASGLAYELRQAYKALEIDTQGIDRICLSCTNHGVKYRTV